MNKVSTKAMAKVAAVATGLAMATSMLSFAPMVHAAALTSAQVQSILSLLSSFGADSSTIANVQASLTGGTPTTTTTTTTTTSSSCSFTKDLTMKSSGAAVTCLQQALIAGGYSIPAGATGYFGAQTQAAVIAWQKALGITPAAGYFGSISRAHWNLGGGTTTTTTGGVTAGTGNGLKVSLSATSPNGSVLVQGQGIGDLADFVFANPTSSPINVTALTFNRTGVSNDSTLTNVYLYHSGTRLTDSAGISNSSFTFSDPTALFTVPAGQTYVVSVRSDIASSGASGSQIGVSLVSATSNGTLDSSVSFPVMGGYQTISSALLATVSFSSVTPSGDITVSAQNDYPVWQDTISVQNTAVKLSSLHFMNLGSADSSSITNLRLYVDGVQVGSAVSSMGADRAVTFDLSSAPAMLSTAGHVVKVLANITNSAAARTIQFSVQRSSDGMFIDSQLNQPVTLTTGGSTFTTAKTGIITIQSAAAGVSVSLDPASPNQNIAVGASNQKFASFDMLASGENVKVSDLYVSVDTSVSNGGLNNGKIMVNGVQIGSTHDIAEAAAGGAGTDFSLGSSLILPAGQTTVVDVYADAQTAAGVNLGSETARVTLEAGSSNGQGVSSYTSTSVPATTYVSANAITISSSSLTASQSTSYGAQTVVAGANNAKIGSFALSTGSTGSVAVNTISITFAHAVSATITNLTLKDSATGNVLGSVITTPSTGNSFPVSLTIPASSSKTIDVYANVISGAANGTIIASVGTGTTGTDQSGNATSVGSPVPLQSIGLGNGLLTVANGAGDPTSNNILAGASSVNVGQFSFAAQNSAYTVQNVAILVPVAQANDVSNVTISYKDVNGATQTVSKALVSDGSTYATATFQGLTMYVPTNDSANLDVSIGVPTIASNATSGEGVRVYLDAGAGAYGDFRAINSAGSATSTLGAGTNVAAGGTFYVRKSIPTLAVNTSGTVLATGSPLYKFSITADPAGAVEWSRVAFNVSTSTNTTITNMYITDDASGTDLINTAVNADANGKVVMNLSSNHATGGAAYQQIAAGATKTYDLYGSFSSSATNYTVTIGLASDSEVITAGTGQADGTGMTTPSFVWSDRSAASHSVTSYDWTNGYLLKNFTSSAISYNK